MRKRKHRALVVLDRPSVVLDGDLVISIAVKLFMCEMEARGCEFGLYYEHASVGPHHLMTDAERDLFRTFNREIAKIVKTRQKERAK